MILSGPSVLERVRNLRSESMPEQQEVLNLLEE